MAWRRTGDKPLPQQMLTQFPDAFVPHWGRYVKVLGADSLCRYSCWIIFIFTYDT